MVEWAEGNSLVMLLAVYFETAGTTWADSVILEVQADGTDTLDTIGRAVAAGKTVIAAPADFPAGVADETATRECWLLWWRWRRRWYLELV